MMLCRGGGNYFVIREMSLYSDENIFIFLRVNITRQKSYMIIEIGLLELEIFKTIAVSRMKEMVWSGGVFTPLIFIYRNVCLKCW